MSTNSNVESLELRAAVVKLGHVVQESRAKKSSEHLTAFETDLLRVICAMSDVIFFMQKERELAGGENG